MLRWGICGGQAATGCHEVAQDDLLFALRGLLHPLARCRNGPLHRASGEGGCPLIEIENGVTTLSRPQASEMEDSRGALCRNRRLFGTLEQIRSGQVRGLVVTTAKRSQLVPELPTVAEADVPDFTPAEPPA